MAETYSIEPRELVRKINQAARSFDGAFINLACYGGRQVRVVSAKYWARDYKAIVIDYETGWTVVTDEDIKTLKDMKGNPINLA